MRCPAPSRALGGPSPLPGDRERERCRSRPLTRGVDGAIVSAYAPGFSRLLREMRPWKVRVFLPAWPAKENAPA